MTEPVGRVLIELHSDTAIPAHWIAPKSAIRIRWQ